MLDSLKKEIQMNAAEEDGSSLYPTQSSPGRSPGT